MSNAFAGIIDRFVVASSEFERRLRTVRQDQWTWSTPCTEWDVRQLVMSRSGDGLRWFKSSYSGSSGGECIEVAYDWRKSGYSDGGGGQCVEVAAHPTAIHVRDSKRPHGPTFAVSPTAWQAFLNPQV